MRIKKEGNIPLCECDEVHTGVIQNRRETMPDEATLYELAEFFKNFGDFTRIRILMALEEGEMCVCDVAELLSMTKSAVSHQLKVLRQSNLISYRKSGKNVYYSLADEHVSDIVKKSLEHIKE